MASIIRIPSEIYETLRQVRLSLENEYKSAAPTMQDLVTVAMQHFMNDWEDPSKNEQLLAELLKSRETARQNMGKRKSKTL